MRTFTNQNPGIEVVNGFIFLGEKPTSERMGAKQTRIPVGGAPKNKTVEAKSLIVYKNDDGKLCLKLDWSKKSSSGDVGQAVLVKVSCKPITLITEENGNCYMVPHFYGGTHIGYGCLTVDMPNKDKTGVVYAIGQEVLLMAPLDSEIVVYSKYQDDDIFDHSLFVDNQGSVHKECRVMRQVRKTRSAFYSGDVQMLYDKPLRIFSVGLDCRVREGLKPRTGKLNCGIYEGILAIDQSKETDKLLFVTAGFDNYEMFLQARVGKSPDGTIVLVADDDSAVVDERVLVLIRSEQRDIFTDDFPGGFILKLGEKADAELLSVIGSSTRMVDGEEQFTTQSTFQLLVVSRDWLDKLESSFDPLVMNLQFVSGDDNCDRVMRNQNKVPLVLYKKPDECLNSKCLSKRGVKQRIFKCPLCQENFCGNCFIGISEGDGNLLRCPGCVEKLAFS